MLFVSADVNGYYRELGVHPRATRRQLMKAYQRLRGDKSVRLTYVLQQLLNPVTRREYDLTPPGQTYLDDYVRAEYKRFVDTKVSDYAVRNGFDVAEVEEAFNNNQSFADMVLDLEPVTQENGSPLHRWSWSFSYYLWGTECEDLRRLERWQHAVVQAFGRRKEHRQIAVGFAGETTSWRVLKVGYVWVLFLGAGVLPTDTLAEEAASYLSLASTCLRLPDEIADTYST